MKRPKNRLRLWESRTAGHGVRSTASRALSRLFRFALFALIVLSVASCRSTKRLTRESQVVRSTLEARDSAAVSITETSQMPVKVPMSTVSLTLTLDSLRLLPQGAVYTARKGQASVKVSHKSPTADEPERLVIEAGCDSLELVCARYAKTISTLKRQLKIASDSKAEHKEEAEESTGNGFLMRLKYFLAGLLAGVIGIVYTFIKLKKK